MKIKSIYIDGLHNAKDKTYTFGDIVYIFGNNGAGKSTILQAIQYALLGYIPGTAKNSKEAILRHSPQNSITVRLELYEVAGDVNTVYIERAINKNINSVEVLPSDYDISAIIKELELPIFNFNDFVGQTANKLKEYFIKNILPTTDGKLDWKQILEESILDCNFQDREAIISYGLGLLGDIDGDALDQVITANSTFKEEQSFNKSKLQRLQNTIDSLIYYDDYTGPTNLESINSDLLSLGAIRDQLIKYESATAATQAASEELKKLETHITNLGGKEGYDYALSTLEQLQNEQELILEKITKNRQVLSSIVARDAMTENIISSKGTCPYTNTSCKSIHDKLETFRNNSAAYKAKKVEFDDAIRKLEQTAETCKINIRQKESIINDYNTTWQRMEILKKTLGDIPSKPETDKTVTELDAEIELLNGYKAKLMANITYNETIESITKEKYEAELQGQALNCWIKKTDTNGLQTTLMVKPFEDLAASMTNYIASMYGRDDIKAHFNISTKANSFSFGLIRDGVYIPYDLLSSGEKCLYSLALMICITNSNKSPLKIMLCDDMFDHLDNQAIESTFEALKLHNVIEEKNGRPTIQFIFAGVKECKNAEDVLLKVE